MFRKSAWAVVFLMLAVAVSPVAVSAVPAGPVMMPMAGTAGAHGRSGGQSPVCNCGMPMQASPATPPANTLPRQAAGTDAAPCSSSPVPGLPGMPNSSGRFSGIRRIYPKNVLDHPERAAVYAMIAARPGTDIAGIGSELGMNRETLRYHLGQLESAARIVVLRDRGIVRYFENHGRYTLLERKVLRHLWNPTAREVLTLVAAHPGITQAEIAARLAISPPTVRWYMQRFCADGIVTRQHTGKYTRYSSVPEAGGIVPDVTGNYPPVLEEMCFGECPKAKSEITF